MTPEQNFRLKAPVLMQRLLQVIPQWQILDAAADAGNAGHESNGLMWLQELGPAVAGSAGGYGWYQWTGRRRREYFAWCKERGLDPAGDEANIGFHIFELTGAERVAIAATTRGLNLEAKVRAFEASYERAGVKHYASRERWARIALDAWNARPGIVPTKRPALMRGSSGDDVRVLQRALNARGSSLAVDGDFGPKTEHRVRVWQEFKGLTVDGVVGPRTWASLGEA